MIPELSPFWEGWYTEKFNGPGLRYEVGVSINNGDLVWLNGPKPCGVKPDLVIFRDGMKNFLEDGERVEADFGYRGEDLVKTPLGRGESKERVAMKSKVRARHETINGRFKSWGALRARFRHDLVFHSAVFRAVAVITQLEIENGEPLFSVTYSDSI